MCRRNMIPAVAMIGFGCGVLVCLCLHSGMVQLFLGIFPILFGMMILRGRG